MSIYATMFILVILMQSIVVQSSFLQEHTSITICENTKGTILCDDQFTLSVVQANYGRHDNITCPFDYINPPKNYTCPGSNQTSYTRSVCQSKRFCVIYPSNSLLGGDPCNGIYKYLTVWFQCTDEVSYSSTIMDIDSISSTITELIVTSPTISEAVASTVLSNNRAESKKNGLIAGLGVGSACMVVLVIAIVFLLRRFPGFISCNKTEEKGETDDDLGNHNIAFAQPNEAMMHDHTAYTSLEVPRENHVYHDLNKQTGQNKSELSDSYLAVYSSVKSKNVDGFRSAPSGPHNSKECRLDKKNRRDKLQPTDDKQEQQNYDYTNPSANFTEHDRKSFKTSHYAVLDPAETGFDRKFRFENPGNYELAKPTSTTTEINDIYMPSKDGVYDHVGDRRHVHVTDEVSNLYSHSADNTYDSANPIKRNKQNSPDYDSFV